MVSRKISGCRRGRGQGRLGFRLCPFSGVGHSRAGRVTQIDGTLVPKRVSLAAREIEAGKARTCLEHYLKFGRYRGYLTDRKARRAANAAVSTPSLVDCGPIKKMLDLVAGRANWATKSDAQLLNKWIEDGYVVLEGAIDDRRCSGLSTTSIGPTTARMSNLNSVFTELASRLIGCLRPATYPPEKRSTSIGFLRRSVTLSLHRRCSALCISYLSAERSPATLSFLWGRARTLYQHSAICELHVPDAIPSLLDRFGGCHAWRAGGTDSITSAAIACVNSSTAANSRARKKRGVLGLIKILRLNSLPRSKNSEPGRNLGAEEHMIAKRGDVLFWNADLPRGKPDIRRPHAQEYRYALLPGGDFADIC